VGNKPLRVLMVDGEVLRQRTIKRIFRVKRLAVEWTCEATGTGAIAAMERAPFDRFLLDGRLADDATGLDVLGHARGARISTPAVIYAAGLDRCATLAALRLGAYPLQFDAATEDLVEAIVDPPFSACVAFGEDDGDLSLYERFGGLRLSHFTRVLAEREGNVHATARDLLIPQRTAQRLVRLLRQREAHATTTG
jgi:ActR/RegA family two-component response regulator